MLCYNNYDHGDAVAVGGVSGMRTAGCQTGCWIARLTAMVVGGQDGSTYSARHPTFHFSPWANYLTYCHLVEGSWLGTQVNMAGYHLLAACPSCPNTYHASQ